MAKKPKSAIIYHIVKLLVLPKISPRYVIPDILICHMKRSGISADTERGITFSQTQGINYTLAFVRNRRERKKQKRMRRIYILRTIRAADKS